ncbi:transposase [Streptomyces melanogenes]|uniref:transposase n=1 Tax=Streptomyces melanogenes TaxID=67326 RepID=UPI003AF399BA
MVDRRVYPTDLSDAEWVVLAQLVPPPRPGGRPPEHPRRELIDALAYWLRAGCARRLLPHDFPPYQTVAGKRFSPPCGLANAQVRAVNPRRVRRCLTARVSRRPSVVADTGTTAARRCWVSSAMTSTGLHRLPGRSGAVAEGRIDSVAPHACGARSGAPLVRGTVVPLPG